ncbi:MAG: NADH-quinone oxidoreductase subunit A [Nitrospirota bacterium]
MPGTYIPSEYLPVLIFLMVSVALGFALLLISSGILGLKRAYSEKFTPYESGVPPVGEPRYRFSVRFYIIAMLFVIFDIEAVYLYPWAIVFDKIGLYAFIEMVIFIVILLVGFIYVWKKEGFKWD